MNKKEPLYIGIRSTGTETLARIQNKDGVELGKGIAKTANICYVVKEGWHAVNEAFHAALNVAMIDPEKDREKYDFHAGVGIKGTEVEEHAAKFRKDYSHNFTTLLLTSDGHVDCLGAHNGKDGSAIVIDEGVVGCLIEGNNLEKLGGWGFPLADEGSAAWLGGQAVKLIFQWQDGHINKSPLLEAVFQRFENNLSDVVKFATSARPLNYASLAHLVIEYATNKKDENAINSIKKAAVYIENIFEGLNNKATNKALSCCLYGGLADAMIPWLKPAIKNRLITPYADGA